MTSELTIGFIGFGEAGFNIARGLRAEGITRLYAYDINTQVPRLGEKIQRRAQSSEVSLAGSNDALARECDVLFSTVTADRAVEAANQTAPFLGPRHLFVDLNSVAPATKQSIDEIVSRTGARFVEAAVMAAVPPHGHRVPMLLGGRAANEFIDMLSPFGMRLEMISEEVGVAVTVKMCRSIVVKGLEALLLECALVANRYGADARVFESLADRFPGVNWTELAGYMIGRVIEHGERRARELEEVALMLRAAGIEPMLTNAASQRQEWGARLGLLEHFNGEVPEDYNEIMRAIAAALEK